MNVIDATRLVLGVDGEIESTSVRAAQRIKSEWLPVDRARNVEQPVPPRELDQLTRGVEAGEGVPPEDVHADEIRRGAPQIRAVAALDAVSFMEVDELSQQRRFRGFVVVREDFDAVNRGKREEGFRGPELGLVAPLDRSELALEDRDEEVTVARGGSKKVLSTNWGPVSSSVRTRSSISLTMWCGVKTSP
jgi:hypothetical protein